MGFRENWALAALVLAACDGSPGGAATDGGAQAAADEGDRGIASACVENDTEPCMCGSLPGRQECAGGSWNACECAGDGLGDDKGTGLNGPAGNGSEATFEWAGGGAAGGRPCVPGTYTGTFDCAFVMNHACDGKFNPDGALVNITGPINIDLVESDKGEFLEIADGRLSGLGVGVIAFGNKMTGQLDCSTQKFRADSVDGKLGTADPLCLDGEHCILIGTEGPYEGDFKGDYDDQALELTGEWDLCSPAFGRCAGPWTARLAMVAP